MSVDRATPAGTAASTTQAAVPYEPGSPVSAEAWDVRSWALLAPDGAPADDLDGACRDGEVEPPGEAMADGSLKGTRSLTGTRSLNGTRSGRRTRTSRDTNRTARAGLGPADPVRELMHRHRGLCERAVDPLEIAAALEAHGVTDRTAARFRHRDVFSLAEELFARVPRVDGNRPAVAEHRASGTEHGRAMHCARDGVPRTAAKALMALLITLLPALLTAGVLAVSASGHVRQAGALAEAAFVVVAAVAVGASVRLALWRVVRAKPNLLTTLTACWLTGYLIFGDRLPGGHSGVGAGQIGFAGTAGDGITVPLVLACALSPALWCARWFTVRARRNLGGSRSLDEFAAGMWPLLTATVVLFGVALLGVQAVVGQVARAVARQGGGHGLFAVDALGATTALGLLLFIALLLTAHGFRRAASTGLGIACGLEAVGFVVGTGTAAGSGGVGGGSGLVTVVVCGCAALGLLACAYRVLSGAFAHHCGEREQRTDPDCADGVHCVNGESCERCVNGESNVNGERRANSETPFGRRPDSAVPPPTTPYDAR